MRMPTGRRKRRRLAARAGERKAERITVGLAVFTAGSLGTLVAGELLRMARRRRVSREAETPENLVDAAGYATRDTLAVARRGIIATPHHETVLFNILQGFLGAFTVARLSTWGIRHGWWPAGNVKISGRHIHHFIPGIVLAFGSGVGALTTGNERVESALSLPFGVGMGLTMDEAALLLDLRDVYWTRQGLLSVQVSLGVTATLAATILGLRMLRRGEVRGVQEGVIPNLGDHGMRSVGALS
ncbi:MAG: hypothetical protein QOD14_1716 [Solirubrobacterales bacterium]|nr:hypothetical protein [Solirubrobacterales bacterium]